MEALQSLRARFGQFFIWFLWGNVALIPLLSLMVHGRFDLMALIGGVVIAGGATAIWAGDRTGTAARVATSLAMAGLISVMVYGLRGSAYQIDVHMYFFAGLALMAGWCDWRALIAYAGLVAVHHLVLNFAMPAAVFPSAHSDLVRVVMHALIVVVQTALLVWLVQRLETMFVESDHTIEVAHNAQTQAQSLMKLEEDKQQVEAKKRQSMMALAGGFETSVLAIVNAVSSASKDIEGSASTLADTARDATLQSSAVARSAEESAMNVQTVASAAEEMSASISEIANQAAMSAQVARSAEAMAEKTGQVVKQLSEAATNISNVVALIQNIAAQTNLLALNATIEAARAGEAGKGFAVVATEVKGLASQTAQATSDIVAQISGVQSATSDTVAAITDITRTIAEISGISAAISAAVEEQMATVQEIGRSTSDVATASGQVSERMAGLLAGSTRTGEAAEQSRGAARELGGLADRLNAEVKTFLTNVRAA